MKRLRVAMIAPPWLRIPPKGYGGIEYVIEGLLDGLHKQGVEVTLFGVDSVDLPVADQRSLYQEEQYQDLPRPVYESSPIPIAHILYALKHIRGGGFDIIHDHNTYFGPSLMAHLSPEEFPPVLHTLHWMITGDDEVARGLPDNRPMYTQLAQARHIFYNGISQAQMSRAPSAMQPQEVPVVHDTINLRLYPFEPVKEDYFITLARFTQDKGQALAAKLCAKLGLRLKMAGNINGLNNPLDLQRVIENPRDDIRKHPDFLYYQRKVMPWIKRGQIEYVGNVSGENKLRFIGKAKALLFPIQWEEPFGLAVIEALACGTPVVAMRRGAMPEIIEHGVNGYLANNEREFAKYMQRVDQIDPEACRRSVEQHFSSDKIARDYLDRYRLILARYELARRNAGTKRLKSPLFQELPAITRPIGRRAF